MLKDKKIIVCVPTFKRPQYLRKNLQSLINQNFEQKFEVLVIDNDISRGGESIINECINDLIKIDYYIEEKKGISSVRNKCISICMKKKADYMIFIDDDEIADKYWLHNLFLVEEKYNAKIVGGPVLCKFEAPVSYAIKNTFFTRERKKTGSKLKNCATGNVLINMEIFKLIENQIFDSFFNIIGGGDTVFFNKLKAHNIDMIWADNAITYEFISMERSQLKHCILRSFYRGNSAFYIFKLNNGLLKSIFKILINILILIINLIRLSFYIIIINKVEIMKICKKIVRLLGFISSIFNYKSREYNITYGE